MDNKITFEEWSNFILQFSIIGNFDPYSYFTEHFGIEDERLKRLKGTTLLEYVADKYVVFPNTLYGG